VLFQLQFVSFSYSLSEFLIFFSVKLQLVILHKIGSQYVQAITGQNEKSARRDANTARWL